MIKTLGQNKSDFIEDFIKLIHYIDENELVASDIYDAGYRKHSSINTAKNEVITMLVNNISVWPKKPRDKKICCCWFWISIFGGEIFAINVNTDETVTKQEWLAACKNISDGATPNANQN